MTVVFILLPTAHGHEKSYKSKPDLHSNQLNSTRQNAPLQRDNMARTVLDTNASLGGQDLIDYLRDSSQTNKQSNSLRKKEQEIAGASQNDESLRLFLNPKLDSEDTPRFFYVDASPDIELLDQDDTDEDVILRGAAVENIKVFSLHSRPEATKVIYLDFDGFNITDTAWNVMTRRDVIAAPPFDLDGRPSHFSAKEQQVILEVWQRVSEDYSPFDIDVTTEHPGNEDFLTRSNASDPNYGVRVLLSPMSGQICGKCGGLAFVGAFGEVGEAPEAPPPARAGDRRTPMHTAPGEESMGSKRGPDLLLGLDPVSAAPCADPAHHTQRSGR